MTRLSFSVYVSNVSKFVKALQTKEKEEKDARLQKSRPAIRALLSGNPNIHHYTTFGTANKLFAHHPSWANVKIEEERRLLFDEHIAELNLIDVVSIILPTLNSELDNFRVDSSARTAHARNEQTGWCIQGTWGGRLVEMA